MNSALLPVAQFRSNWKTFIMIKKLQWKIFIMEIYNEDSVVALTAPLSLPCPTDFGVEKLMYGERSSLSCLA